MRINQPPLFSGAVVSGFIADAAVVSGSIASGAVGQFHLSSGAVNSGHLGANSVLLGNIGFLQVNADRLTDGACQGRVLAASAVSSGKLANNSV